MIRVRELVRTGDYPLLASKTFEDLDRDSTEAAYYNYDNMSNDDIGITGNLLPEVIGKPWKYLVKNSEKVINLLLQLKKQGKTIILITNAEVKYYMSNIRNIMDIDHLELFDYVVTDAKKPTYFNGKSLMHAYDRKNTVDAKGPATKGEDFDFDKERITVHGNLATMMEHL